MEDSKTVAPVSKVLEKQIPESVAAPVAKVVESINEEAKPDDST